MKKGGETEDEEVVVHSQVMKIKQQESDKSGSRNEMRRVWISFRRDSGADGGRRISPSPLGRQLELAHHRAVSVGDF
uniref:Uncharacterized protein n=1 Tax=Kalanchoe fedtschenkoi TaxID=63787 RepID=A0A7N0V495_KALFE